MLTVLRLFTRLVELVVAIPVGIVRWVVTGIALNPRLGPLRHLATAGILYLAFSVALVYVFAPIRGLVGRYYLADTLRYAEERWQGTAIFDLKGNFIGSFEPRLDSKRDVNWTDFDLSLGDYIASRDHKTIPVLDVPEHYWQCLTFHEDRYLGTVWNPFGIDLMGVLKIPVTSIRRSIALGRPSLGVGGSTLPMQLVRVLHDTPPSASESAFAKLVRKVREWWLAPVLYMELTRGGDDTALRQWAANHIWLAQRTGGRPLHGVEMTGRVVFGKEAKDLSIAEQFVLASAVNKPIILLEGNEKLNEVRLDRWRYITEVRARMCAEKLIADPAVQRQVVFELVQLASGPPDPKVRPRLQATLETHAPAVAKRAFANPFVRASALLPSARFGLREQMKEAWGFGWRDHVRGVTVTLDAGENLAFEAATRAELTKIDTQWQSRLNPGWTLDPAKALAPGSGLKAPHVVVAAADHKGEIVRYYEWGEQAVYFGSPFARDPATGHYAPEREQRRIASTAKMLLAVAIANEGRDTVDSLYADAQANGRSTETCEKGDGTITRNRRALVAFACSLARPLEWRGAQLGQARIRRLIDGFGFNMPPAPSASEETPPSTAAARGLIGGAPRRVHHMAGVILASLIGQGGRPVPPPTLVRRFDQTGRQKGEGRPGMNPILPSHFIAPHARQLVKALLSAPLCYLVGSMPAGTLKGLADWCSERRAWLDLHFAKTGTDTNDDPSQTVETWIAGGLRFGNGAAYSYVVLIGTGSTREAFATNLHAGQVAVPLLRILLDDLEAHARRNPVPALVPQRPQSAPAIAAPHVAVQAPPRSRGRLTEDARKAIFQGN